jgi:hypothetical protein
MPCLTHRRARRLPAVAGAHSPPPILPASYPPILRRPLRPRNTLRRCVALSLRRSQTNKPTARLQKPLHRLKIAVFAPPAHSFLAKQTQVLPALPLQVSSLQVFTFPIAQHPWSLGLGPSLDIGHWTLVIPLLPLPNPWGIFTLAEPFPGSKSVSERRMKSKRGRQGNRWREAHVS